MQENRKMYWKCTFSNLLPGPTACLVKINQAQAQRVKLKKNSMTFPAIANSSLFCSTHVSYYEFPSILPFDKKILWRLDPYWISYPYSRVCDIQLLLTHIWHCNLEMTTKKSSGKANSFRSNLYWGRMFLTGFEVVFCSQMVIGGQQWIINAVDIWKITLASFPSGDEVGQAFENH